MEVPDATVLHYTTDALPALWDDDDDCYNGPAAGNATATRLTVGPDVIEIGEGTFYKCSSLLTLQGMGDGVVTIGEAAFQGSGITTLRGVSANVAEICDYAFSECSNLTTLQGLSRNVTAIGDFSNVTDRFKGAFYSCPSLASIGPGFSPACLVHPHTFDNCPALLAAAKAGGFTTAIEWGRHHWLAPSRRRFAVLTAVRQLRQNPLSAANPSPLLSLLAGAPDDIVRVVVGFMGEGEVESEREKEARWELAALSRSGEIGRQNERAERLEELVERQRERIEELLMRVPGGHGAAPE